MTQPFDDEHGDRLRRALHAEAEAVTPSPDGLERIRNKINQRRERRLSLFSLSAPWLRPLAAVAAAVCVCIAAASVTPALANFVQTGHFSPDTGGGDGKPTNNDGQSEGQVPPGQVPRPVPSVSPSPTAIHPSSTGKHVVTGSCQPGEETVSPSGSPAAGGGAPAGSTPKVTCQPVPGGSDTSSGPPTEGPPTSSPPPPPAGPSDQPTSESDPTVNPNSSP